MPKTPTPRPLEMSYFLTGFYTYRSQLFAPFRAIGINIVSYHDPVLDGADFELTDLFEWQQRPGFTQFCSVALAEGEIINQFYSARALDGVLLTMFDSNQRLATFSTDSITTIYTKNTTAQGYINQVGDTTYFYDGVDAVRNDQIYGLGPNGIAAPTSTVTVSDTGGWLPDTFYKANSVLLDYNGNIQYAASSTSAGTSLLAQSSNATVNANNTYWESVVTGQWRTTGYATSGGITTPLSALYFTDFGFSIPSNAVILGVQVSFICYSQSSTDAEIVGVSLFSEGSNIGTTIDPGTPILSYPTITTETYGTSTDTWGATLTPSVVNDPSFGFGISIQLGNIRVFNNTPFTMRVFYFIPAGSSGTAGVSGNQMPTWSALPSSFTTDGTLRWNNLGPMGVWEPGVAYTIPSVILDSNNNLESVSLVTAIEPYDNSTTYNSGDVVLYSGQYWTAQGTFSGIVPNSGLASSTTSGSTTTYTYNWIQTPNPQTSGGTVPVWPTTVGGQVTDGALLWTNIGPGSIFVNAGYSYGVCYRTLDGHLSTMSTAVPTSTFGTGPILGGSPLGTSNISSFSITSDIVTFFAEQTYSPGEAVYVQGMTTGTYLNNEVFTVISSVGSASYSITNVSLTSNVATITADNSLVAGTQVNFQSLVSATFLNGVTATVLSSGLSSTQFEVDFTHGNYSSTPDSGTAIVVANFTAAFIHANVSASPDTGIVSPVIAQLSGTGISDPRLVYSTAITNVSVSGNLVTLECDNIFFPGTTILVSGLSNANFLNGFTLQIETATPTQITAYFETPDYESTADSGLATFMGIEIYRTADGGGIWYYAGVAQNSLGTATGVPGTTASVGAGIAWQNTAGVVGTGNGTSLPVSIVSYSVTSNVVSFVTVPQSLVAGQSVEISNLYYGTYLNGQTLVVSSTGLSSTGFEAAFTNGDVASTLDSGLATPTTANAYAVTTQYTSEGNYTSWATQGGWSGVGFAAGPGVFAGALPWSVTAFIGDGVASVNGVNGFEFGSSASAIGNEFSAPTLPEGAVIQSIIPVAIGCSFSSGWVNNTYFKVVYTGGSNTFDLSTGGVQTGSNLGTDLSILSSISFEMYTDSTQPSYPDSGSGTWNGAVGFFGVAINYTVDGTPTPADQLQTLQTTDYGFNIPVSATGVVVNFSGGTINTASGELQVQLTVGGNPVGTVQTINPVGSWQTSYTLGSPSDLSVWGLNSLTAAQVNGENGLGVNITGTLPVVADESTQANVNDLSVQISYTGGTWTFTDIYPDSDLNEQLVAPIAHLNDPPPGQTGSIASPFAGGSLCTYWQGRQWLAQGQYLYFDGGEDVLNGDPHQSWPPGNRFEYPGTINGIAALDKGLVVLGADYYGLVLGGPQTLSFYPIVILKNFGITSPNALYQDGQTLHVLSTQGQLWQMTMEEKTNEGHYISDYISANFPPGSSYVTVHRNGEDAGVWLGNGSTTLLRSGINIGGAWSVPYFPIGGVGAINSIETSVGTYSLCAAPTTAGGYIMARDLNAWQDMNGQYTSDFATNGCGITLGSITLSGPGEELPPVEYIVVYADAAGVNGTVDQPIVAILPNEIKATNNLGFVTIPPDQVTPEPPPPAALVSTSLQQLRYPVKMVNNSQITQFMHHLQVRVLYPSTDAPHTLKALSIKFDHSN